MIADGAEVFHTTLANPGEARADILRITYSWDTGSGDTGAAPGWGRLSVERPEHDKAVSRELTGAPPLFPVLFITIACGACSGFHCLVASGTTSKQVTKETHAKPVAYGSATTAGP